MKQLVYTILLCLSLSEKAYSQVEDNWEVNSSCAEIRIVEKAKETIRIFEDDNNCKFEHGVVSDMVRYMAFIYSAKCLDENNEMKIPYIGFIHILKKTCDIYVMDFIRAKQSFEQ